MENVELKYYKNLCKIQKQFIDGKISKEKLTDEVFNLEEEYEKSKKSVFKHPLHRVWSDMIMRCENPKRPYYYLYGGRGIKVCDEWRKDYLSFYNWSIKNGYKIDKMASGRNKWTIDRLDPNGNYCPENCRWAHYRDASNKRIDLSVEYKGETKTAKEWVQKLNSNVSVFYKLLRSGMNEIQAIEYIDKQNNATV
jgi:hypothetical protein